jgi:signal transduction histidine kinase
MKFADVLASTIHDIKNALGMVINTLDEITAAPGSGLAGNPKVVTLQLEARRANNDLVQLLTLYKLDEGRVKPRVAEHNLADYLEDMVVEHQALARARGIALDYQCDPFLSAFFDVDLVSGVLSNAIGNAERYTRDRICLTATTEQDGGVVLGVEDNGPGFPASMLAFGIEVEPEEGLGHGRTRLGLYFSSQVAALHCNGDRVGQIRLSNGGRLGGGRFEILLP